MSALFFHNPKAGAKQFSTRLEHWIKEAYEPSSKKWELRPIDFSTLDAEIRVAAQQGISEIFAVGGDGTVNAVGQCLRYGSLALGVIPMGSGNGFARHLGYSIQPEVAIRQSVSVHRQVLDTAELNGRFFLNVAGIGLDAEVAHAFAAAGRRGFGPYAQATSKALFNSRPTGFSLMIDEETHRFNELIGVAIANGSQWGYEAQVSSRARMTDGWFEVVAVAPFPLHLAPLVIASLFNGDFSKWPFVHTFRARHVQVSADVPSAWHLDGEPIGMDTHFEASLFPQSLNVLLPSTLRQDRQSEI